MASPSGPSNEEMMEVKTELNIPATSNEDTALPSVQPTAIDAVCPTDPTAEVSSNFENGVDNQLPDILLSGDDQAAAALPVSGEISDILQGQEKLTADVFHAHDADSYSAAGVHFPESDGSHAVEVGISSLFAGGSEVAPALDVSKEKNASSSVDFEDKQTLLAVLQFLKKHNLKDTEELLKKEAQIKREDELEVKSAALGTSIPPVPVAPPPATPQSAELSSATTLASYKSEEDPSVYQEQYESLKQFVERSLDVHRCELACVVYPIFVHMYLELVYNNQEQQVKQFFDKFSGQQEDYYSDDLMKLSTVTKSEHMKNNQLMENYKASKFTIRMSRDSYNHLKRFLIEKRLDMLLNIIQEHLFIDVFDGAPRSKQQIDATSGALLGDAKKEVNKTKVYYGLLKEPDITINANDDDKDNDNIPGSSQNAEDGKSAKRRRPRKDPQLTKKSKNDPNAPVVTRIPLPEIKDSDRLEKVKAFREASRRVSLGADNLPSICFYTFVNSVAGVTCVQICEDTSMLAAGFADSVIKVWSLTSTKLCSIKSADELNLIDKEADDVLERIIDERTSSDSKTLRGHSGPVYATSFSHDKAHLISASEDGTVRLWSLYTWTNLVCYKGHIYPVWDVKFGPYGHYFASVGADRTARLWSTDHPQPVRLFAGHLTDIDCIEFHPNSNYIATGSSDRTVRMWDLLNGACVRIFTGHKGSIHVLLFSPDGRYLTSAGTDKMILLWDIATGDLITQFCGHTDTIYSLAYSRDSTVLASGGKDNTVKLWDVERIFSELQDSELPPSSLLSDGRTYEIGSFRTKSTPVLAVRFTRRNLLLASGPFVSVTAGPSS